MKGLQVSVSTRPYLPYHRFLAPAAMSFFPGGREAPGWLRGNVPDLSKPDPIFARSGYLHRSTIFYLILSHDIFFIFWTPFYSHQYTVLRLDLLFFAISVYPDLILRSNLKGICFLFYANSIYRVVGSGGMTHHHRCCRSQRRNPFLKSFP